MKQNYVLNVMKHKADGCHDCRRKTLIHLLGKLPHRCIVACSGGSDSIAVLDFMMNHGKRDVTAAYFNHGTKHGAEAEEFMRALCAERDIPSIIGSSKLPRDNKESSEEYWRRIRYLFLQRIGKEHDCDVISAHHLDDVIETYIFSSLHGTAKLIPYRNGRVIRPFLMTAKSMLNDWCVKHDLKHIEDESNNNDHYMRNYIRHQIVPVALHVNPGLHKTLKKKLAQRHEDDKAWAV